MSGDVFGNGLLRSESMCLVAAFNHRSVFIDPSPDAKVAFQERQRLFELPRSDWSDYDPTCLSEGGAVYSRAAKLVQLSAQAMAVLDITTEQLTPDELIQAILSAPVDLMWHGGIGTYVKADQETNDDVGDRVNDQCRIQASALRCRVIGEGANLGLTQLARIQFAQQGGRINTDFIDNVGGVNCSDHEVNIKIILSSAVENGDMTTKQRNALLRDMEPDIDRSVLKDTYRQNVALSIASKQLGVFLDLYIQYINHCKKNNLLNPVLEFLPTKKEIQNRVTQQREPLTRPELSILLTYCKNILRIFFNYI